MRKIVEIVGKIPCKKGGYIYHAYQDCNSFGMITTTFYHENEIPFGTEVEVLTIDSKSYFVREVYQ